MRRISILLLVFFTCFVLSAWAGHVTYVPPPNGTDDTANIQAALNSCAAYGKNCTVQLAAGTYHTRQLVENNFQGTFKGMGTSNTTIQAIYPLPVNIPDPYYDGECTPNTTSCLWPTLIIFINGNIEVSDLSILELAPPGEATTGWYIEGVALTDLLDALRFMGKSSISATVDRISVEGQVDNSPTSTGFNLINGAGCPGELPRSSTPFDFYLLTCTFTVRNSSFQTMDDGVGVDHLTSSFITIGGSPSNGNNFENVYGGMDMESAEKSQFEISYNTSSGINAAMWVEPWPYWVPSKPSQYYVHDNQFIGTADYWNGMFFYDTPATPWIQASAWNNTIKLQGALMEGIGAYNTKGTAIFNNTVTGSDGADAIGLWNSSLGTVIGNNVSGFTVDPTGFAQIYLDPSTTYDFVLCANPSNTSLNQGTNNAVLGCQQLDSAAKTVGPSGSKRGLGLSKGKPWLRHP